MRSSSVIFLAQNPGELKNIRVGLSSWTDHRFYRWAAWFWANSLMPGWAEANHESCRQLAALSIEARAAEEAEYGDKVDMNKTALETIKMFHNKQEMEDFLSSAQASFWRSRGHEFLALSPEQRPGLAGARMRRKECAGLVKTRRLLLVLGPGHRQLLLWTLGEDTVPVCREE